MSNLDKRPTSLDEFVGKDSLKQNLKVYLESAKNQQRNLDHILFYGIAGLGKTTLASIIANEMNAHIHYVQGSSIKFPCDVLDLLSLLSENDVIFIDEIHTMDHKCMEYFYSIMEDFVVDLKLGPSMNAKFTRLQVPHFTLVGSTTKLSQLPIPFIERFGIKFYIQPYSEEEITQILNRINKQADHLLTKDDLWQIANISKGVPRIAINYYKRFYDYRLIAKASTKEILSNLGIHEDGLEEKDVNYLKCLVKNTVGIKTISQVIGLDAETIEKQIEPFLLQNGYINKTRFGRQLTLKGLKFLEKLRAKR